MEAGLARSWRGACLVCFGPLHGAHTGERTCLLTLSRILGCQDGRGMNTPCEQVDAAIGLADIL